MTPAQLRKAMLADLARSGLTATDAVKLGFEPDEYQPGGWNAERVPAYRIPYLDLNGEPTGFSRLKLLGPCLDAEGKPMKYSQEPGSANHLYLPPGIDWRAVLADPSVEIWLVEGEKKAAAMCKLGLPCVGIGGVDSYQNRDKSPVNGLAQLARGGRVVNILFDSDA